MKQDSKKRQNTLFDFAFFPRFLDNIDELVGLASKEDWGKSEDDRKHPILRRYLSHTFSRLCEEQKITYASNNEHACFNTGLTDSYYENIFAFFAKNKKQDTTSWFFLRFTRKSDRQFRNAFDDKFPERANYFDDPSKLIYNPNKELDVNYAHIIRENSDRFPSLFQEKSDRDKLIYLKGAIKLAEQKVESNYKIAVPQYYHGKLGLLLPLCLTEGSTNADLALTVMETNNKYLASTCLNLDMAYTTARLIVKPESDWLRP